MSQVKSSATETSKRPQRALSAESLRACEVFQDLSFAEVAALARAGHLEHCDRRETIFREGEPANGFYALLRGQVKIYKLSPDGREQVLRIVRRGETFAEAAALSRGAYPASAEALAPSEVAFFPIERFQEVLAHSPGLALNIILTLCKLLRGFSQLVDELALREVSARVAKYLLDLAARAQAAGASADAVRLDLPKWVLASRLGTVSETLSRTFAKLRQRGLIEVEGSHVRILDRPGLESVSAGERAS